MRIIKHLSFLLSILLFMLSVFMITAFAHPGKTDGSGGHTDHSTGEYHFHHGYPEHSHYDVDGDGTIDCPYDFDDKTGHDSGTDVGTSTSSNSQGITTKPKVSQPYPSVSVSTKDDNREEDAVPIWIRVLMIVLTVLVILMAISLIDKNNKIKSQQKELEAEKKNTRETIQSLVVDLERLMGNNILNVLVGVPEGEYIDANMLPVQKDEFRTKAFKWGYKYTFYRSKTTSKYHRHGCRYCNSSIPINAYSIQRRKNSYTPCQVCHPRLPDVSWVDRYIKYKKFFDKHNIKVSAKRED